MHANQSLIIEMDAALEYAGWKSRLKLPDNNLVIRIIIG